MVKDHSEKEEILMVRSKQFVLLCYLIFIMHLNFERVVLKCNILITYLT